MRGSEKRLLIHAIPALGDTPETGLLRDGKVSRFVLGVGRSILPALAGTGVILMAHRLCKRSKGGGPRDHLLWQARLLKQFQYQLLLLVGLGQRGNTGLFQD